MTAVTLGSEALMFHVEIDEDLAILTATKRIEGRHRWTAREQIDDLLNSGTQRLIVDLSLVDLIDSSGLASLVAAFRRAQSVGGELCVCGLSQKVRNVFELTLLHEVIAIFSDREEAIEHLGANAPAEQTDPSTS